MADASFRVEGLRELEEALNELPKATHRNVMKRVLMKAGRPIEAAAEAAAPVFREHLRKSIEVSTKLSRRQRGLHVKHSAVEVFVGPKNLPQAHLQEFGTVNHSAQPFMRPAWDGNKMRALEGIKEDMWKEIEKAGKRLAKKAAKLK